MGAHERPEAKYRQPKYRVESPTPKHGLGELTVEQIEDKIENTWVSAFTDEDSELDNGSPERAAANQLQWELELLGDENPELAISVVRSLTERKGYYRENLAMSMIPPLCNTDLNTALELADQFLSDGNTRFTMSAALGNAVRDGLISDPATVANLVTTFAYHYGEANEDAQKAEAARKQAESDRAHALGQAARKAGPVVHMTNTIVGDGVTAIVLPGKPGDERK